MPIDYSFGCLRDVLMLGEKSLQALNTRFELVKFSHWRQPGRQLGRVAWISESLVQKKYSPKIRLMPNDPTYGLIDGSESLEIVPFLTRQRFDALAAAI